MIRFDNVTKRYDGAREALKAKRGVPQTTV